MTMGCPDGTTWSPVRRIPIDPVGSDVDHFIPGLAVGTDSAGPRTQLAVTYYFYPSADCTAATCQLEVGFTSSRDAGQHWSTPQTLAGPITPSPRFEGNDTRACAI
ncbi:MAG TPA: sialidase family protein [Pseudonocardiaceae bacterium]|nr:sialidase family protein [Pseudonocardiaceae bacterium]